MLKNIFIICFLIASAPTLLGQRTYVNSISPKSAKIGETVTISGNGFSSTSSDLSVFFGGVQGTITNSTTTLIETEVPAGAAFGKILVINKVSGFSSASSADFSVNYGGDSFNGQTSTVVDGLFDLLDIQAGQNLVYDLCNCDFDGDGLIDVALTAQEDAVSRAKRLIYRNTSTATSTSFSKVLELRNQPASHTACKDLNADGKPDVVFSEINVTSKGDSGTEDIEIYQNTSTVGSISFNTPTFLVPPTASGGVLRNPTRLELEDVDDDGKIDIIMTNDSDESVDFFLNTSTAGGSIAFNDVAQQITLPTGEEYEARGVDFGDLNNDNLIDMVIIPFQSNTIFIYENQSITGTVAFREPTTFSSIGDSYRNAEIADLDGDGFADIAVTNDLGVSNGEILSFINTTGTAESRVSFSESTIVSVGVSPWNLKSGDIDGDGDIDLVATFSDKDATTLSVLANASSTGNLSFSRIELTTNLNSRNVSIADINNDSKPDILYSSKSLISTQGNLSILSNRNCVIPVITPTSDIYCPGNTFIVEATAGAGLTYEWFVNGTSVQNSASNTYDISANSTDILVTVTTTTNDGRCVKSSATGASFTVNSNTPSNPTMTSPANAVCDGSTISLSSDVTANNYFWTGPNEFSSSSKDVSITAAPETAGTYELVIQNSNGCKSQPATALVEVLSTPVPKITNQGVDNFCIGDRTTLETNSYSGYSYQWVINGSNNSTTTSVIADQTGDFTLTLIDQSNTSCTNTSLPYNIQEVNPPSPSITSVDEICVDLPMDFAGDTLSGRPEFGLTYSWDFQNASLSSIGTDDTQNPSFTFNSAGSFTANLTTAYVDVANCAESISKTVTAFASPTIPIQAESLLKCPEDSILLSIDQTILTHPISSFSWSTGDTSSTTNAITPAGIDTVTVDLVMINSIGCTIRDTTEISNYTDGGITITSTDPNVLLVDSTIDIPQGYLSVNLMANGGSDYAWEPGFIFSDSLGTVVDVFPRSVSTDIVLSGTDINGCFAEYNLELNQGNIFGRKSFSPDGNGLGFDCWQMVNVNLLGSCKLYIFDQRGRTIFQDVDGTLDPDCTWDGFSDGGLKTPEGIYYFVLKCENKDESQKGTILLARDE